MKLQVGTFLYQVNFVSNFEGSTGDLGQCDPNKLIISIDQDLPPEVKRTTFFHEVLHACCDYVGIKGEMNEEEYVTRLTNVLYQTLKENPSIIYEQKI
jgi:hypothetical protein